MRGLTQEQAQNRLDTWTHSKFQLTSEYKNQMARVTVLCRDCGLTFDRIYKNFGKCKTCKGCNRSGYTLTTEEVQEELTKIRRGLVLLGEYKKEKQPVSIKYPCGCIHQKTLGNLRAGRGLKCHVCEDRISYSYRQTLRDKTQHKLQNKLVFGKFSLENPESYRTSADLTKIRCFRCETVFDSTPDKIISSDGKCPECFPKYISLGEGLVSVILKDMGIVFEKQYKIGNRFYDFFLPEHRILLEYDGKQHEEGWLRCPLDLKNQKRVDKEKDLLAKDKNLHLIRIAYNQSIVHTLIENLHQGSTTTENTSD